MRRTIVAVVVALLPGAVGADGPPPVDPGARLRVSVAGSGARPISGTLDALRDGSLVLATDGQTRAFPLATISRVEVSQGRHVSRRAVVIGAVAGGVAGALVGGCLANKDDYGVACAGQDDTKYVIGGLVGGVAGGALGAWLGKSERWEDVDLRRSARLAVLGRTHLDTPQNGPPWRRR
jgi:surface antigen